MLLAYNFVNTERYHLHNSTTQQGNGLVNRYRVNCVLAGQRRSIDVTEMQVKTATEIVNRFKT